MKIGGHRMREHLRLLAPFFAFIAAVWLIRMTLWSAGAPAWLVRLVSVTVATALSIMLTAFLMHWRGFGSYANMVLAGFLLTAWSELLIAGAIKLAVVTGTDNVYTLPEYTFPAGDPRHVEHIRSHLTFGIGVGTLEGAAVGCLLLWLLRMLVPSRTRAVPRESKT